jgi:RNA polymerase sigma-70 factor (ECF subfamily)
MTGDELFFNLPGARDTHQMTVSRVLDPAWFLAVLSAPPEEERARPHEPLHPELVAACRRGDRKALEQVFREHAPALQRFLARLAGPRLELADLLQDTFAGAITAFARFRGEATVRTWLHGIALRVVQEHLRRAQRNAHQPLDAASELAGTSSPEVDERRRRITRRLYAHLDHVEPRKRIALLLHVVEGLPLADVAALMGASLTATKSRVFWARRALLRSMRRDPSFAAEERES